MCEYSRPYSHRAGQVGSAARRERQHRPTNVGDREGVWEGVRETSDLSYELWMFNGPGIYPPAKYAAASRLELELLPKILNLITIHYAET